MIDKLVCDIDEYIDYLKKKGLHITIHGNITEYMSALLKYNLHDNPYCAMVKSDDMAWERCICSQSKIYSKKCSGYFFGMCHAGIEEYIFFADSNMFVSVSGYGINRTDAVKRIKRLSENFFLDKNVLIKIYDERLIHEKPNEDELAAVIKPLCHMIEFLNMLCPKSMPEQSKNALYNSIQTFIMRNFMKNITVRDIAHNCSCSVSTACHLFKEISGKGVHEYITELRIEQARNLLENSNLSIGMIAQTTGFSDPDYFSYAFKKRVGAAPSKYRKSEKRRLNI